MTFFTLLTIVSSACVMAGVVELIRRRRLKEKYAILWLFAGAGLMTLSLTRSLLEQISVAIGIFYPPSLLFLVAFGFLTLINLHYSTVISQLTERSNKLAQEVALLRAEVKQGREAGSSDPAPKPGGAVAPPL
ncbi:MAG: DUF2304 domain-containing protein [Deltaproteobacteria bacterium]|nr:DUF2304 domain-containing protein [Deltaproteobacteria bacterium]